jgi:glycosyltransferase involved in cell wall biosynthesis
MVIKNEEFYIDMAIRSVVRHVDGIYVLDTGSTDGTIQKITDLQKTYGNIICESKKFCVGDGRFPSDYDEVVSRNYAIDKAIQTFGDVSWIIILDGDEILNDRYFEDFENAKASGSKTIGHATNIPVSPYLVWNEEKYFTTWSDKWHLFDPHVRAWSTQLDVKFVRRKENISHMILKVVGREEDLHHEYVMTDNVHFHLHRSFGPKSLYRYIFGINMEVTGREACAKIGIDYSDIFNQELIMTKFPQYFDYRGKFIPPFNLDKNWMNNFAAISHPMPNFVIDRWKSWGYWL